MTDPQTSRRTLIACLVTLSVLCAAFVAGARLLGRRGMYLVQAYMLTPALAAVFARAVFHEPRFRDADLRLGRVRDYVTV